MGANQILKAVWVVVSGGARRRVPSNVRQMRCLARVVRGGGQVTTAVRSRNWVTITVLGGGAVERFVFWGGN